MFQFDLSTLLFRIVAFAIAFSIHEYAHAFIAYRLGDDTAKRMGRLTLNPMSHVDPFGLIMILFGPFGWAKPVPFNPYNLKGNKRLSIVFVSIAGPLSNLILAFGFLKLLIWLDASAWTHTWPTKSFELAYGIFEWSFYINTALFIFNLLPIPPLDGSKILRYLLPAKTDPHFDKYEPYGVFILLLLIIIPGLSGIIFGLPLEWVANSLISLAS